MAFSPLITQLIAQFRCLPGVGPKSAQRMVFHLLERARTDGLALAKIIERAIQEVGHCEHCRSLSETSLCTLCSNPHRDSALLCVVETPIDVLAIEQTASYRGYYFVLMGRLSPLDGIGPEELGIKHFVQRINTQPPQEIILATNPTVEGEATAHYLSELIQQKGIKVSRIAHGVPLGSELEFIDGHTLARSLSARVTVDRL
ncbi:MAG: recombination protein RecR [Candidatus Aquirickettsiella gammari]|jgi:recombination protein RecR|uniref:Recombination protein RecR n=1 Tax=Candidatus Aquirickettsiella gammari TaxID=2016198 RepID=A0A370CKK0_9COXI|nr:MAG: recombination protein RecR [Candidatus Aquirickettsiella gammari]